MSAPTIEGSRQSTPEQFNDIIRNEFGPVAERLGYGEDELLAAFAPGRVEDSYHRLDVAGMTFDSFRYQVGVMAPSDRSRGGLELTGAVTGEKIFGKALAMYVKHLIGDTGNVGGKSGIRATREELEALSPKERAQLMALHAEAHDINPYTNVVATDINTYEADMDAIALSRVPRYGRLAGAAASGASEKYGGIPKLHAPHTGHGSSIVQEQFLHKRVKLNDVKAERIAEAMKGGRPLRLLVQGMGKAGAPFVETLPNYIQLAGALEQYGAIVAPEGHLDRAEVLRLANTTKLGEASVKAVQGALWLPPEARSEFWATKGVDLIAPAFDRNQITAEDARNIDDSVIAITDVANGPVALEARSILNEREIDELPGEGTNIGGTISSQLGSWDKIMDGANWTPQGFERKWRQSMLKVAHTMLSTRERMSAERGEFVSLPEAIEVIAVHKAIQRLRASQ